MKHYGAVLTGPNNIVDGSESSSLVIGTSSTDNDNLVIHNIAGPSGSTDKLITASGLVIVPSAAGRGNSFLIGADGREVSYADVVAGAGVAASTNSATGTFPIKGVNAANESIFANSIITEIAPSGGLNYDATGDGATAATNSNADGINIAGNLVVSDNVTITGNIEVAGTATYTHPSVAVYADKYIEFNVGTTRTTAKTAGDGGFLVETAHDAGGGNPTFGGFRYNSSATNNSKLEYSADAGADGSGTWTPLADGLSSVRGAAGISVATTGTVDGLTPSTSSPTIKLDLDTTATGGLGFTVGTDAAGQVGIKADGVRETMLATAADTTNSGDAAAASGDVLVYNDAGDGSFTWVAQSDLSITPTSAYTADHTAATGGVITVPAATHLQTGSDFTVIVSEYLTSGGVQHTGAGAVAGLRKSQIIPESIIVGSDSSGSGGSLEGTVTIQLSAAQAANQFRVKISS